MPEVCVLCRSRFPRDKLYSACKCYKKSDSNRLHKECLAAIYANKESDEPPRCPDCLQAYRVSVTYRFFFAWHRACTCRSIGHMCELITIVVMMACGIFTLLMFQRSPEYQRRQHRAPSSPAGDADIAGYLIYVLFGLTLLLVPFTMRKVWQRWKQVNSEVEVDIV